MLESCYSLSVLHKMQGMDSELTGVFNLGGKQWKLAFKDSTWVDQLLIP